MNEDPRGIRNNNPGNIRITSPVTRWVGMSDAQTDPLFVQFDRADYGIRAMGRILRNSFAAGHTSVEELIERWAPRTENTSYASYARFVADHAGVYPDMAMADQLFEATLPLFIQAMIQYENGEQPYSMGYIINALALP